MGHATWHPKWWTEQHGSAWDLVKESMRRDWEQTKSDLHLGGKDLNQDVGDTLKQAAGADVIPAGNTPNVPGGVPQTDAINRGMSWDDAEEPLAYGFGAREQYGKDHATWDDDVESRLRTDWESKDKGGSINRAWNDVKSVVRHGYERARA